MYSKDKSISVAEEILNNLINYDQKFLKTAP